MRKVKDAVDLTTNEKIYFKSHAKATYLSDGRNVEDAITNLPSGKSSVFEAKFKETSYEEIKAAFEANKVVYCYWDARIYMLSRLEASAAYFAVTHGNYYYRLVCYTGAPSTSWGTTSENFQHSLENLANGNAQITIAGKTAEVVTQQNVSKQGVIRQTQTWTQAADSSYDYVMQDIVRGNIPSFFIDLWKSRGGNTATFNEATGYFEYQDLKDISYEEASAIYAIAVPVFQGNIFANFANGRAILPQISNGGSNGSISLNTAFTRASFESISMADLNNSGTIINNVSVAFFSAEKLRHIGGVLRLKSITTLGDNIFNNCYSLRTLQLKEIKASIGFGTCPKLSNSSILYMIQNEIATSAIVITLHTDAYARAMADTDIQAALEAHPNVSLASA